MTVIISSPTPSPSTLGLGLVWVRCPASGARTQPGPCVVWRVRPTPAVNFLPCFDLILEVLHFLSAKSDQIRINVVDALGWGWGGGGGLPVLSVLGVGVMGGGVEWGWKEEETRLINF